MSSKEQKNVLTADEVSMLVKKLDDLEETFAGSTLYEVISLEVDCESSTDVDHEYLGPFSHLGAGEEELAIGYSVKVDAWEGYATITVIRVEKGDINWYNHIRTDFTTKQLKVYSLDSIESLEEKAKVKANSGFAFTLPHLEEWVEKRPGLVFDLIEPNKNTSDPKKDVIVKYFWASQQEPDTSYEARVYENVGTLVAKKTFTGPVDFVDNTNGLVLHISWTKMVRYVGDLEGMNKILVRLQEYK